MAPKNEGMSTSKKVIAGAAVGVALPAAVGTARKLTGTKSRSAKIAKRLKVTDRSNMAKSQLQRAVSRAKSRG
jgi:hypothetical protein